MVLFAVTADWPSQTNDLHGVCFTLSIFLHRTAAGLAVEEKKSVELDFSREETHKSNKTVSTVVALSGEPGRPACRRRRPPLRGCGRTNHIRDRKLFSEEACKPFPRSCRFRFRYCKNPDRPCLRGVGWISLTTAGSSPRRHRRIQDKNERPTIRGTQKSKGNTCNLFCCCASSSVSLCASAQKARVLRCVKKGVFIPRRRDYWRAPFPTPNYTWYGFKYIGGEIFSIRDPKLGWKTPREIFGPTESAP